MPLGDQLNALTQRAKQEWDKFNNKQSHPAQGYNQGGYPGQQQQYPPQQYPQQYPPQPYGQPSYQQSSYQQQQQYQQPQYQQPQYQQQQYPPHQQPFVPYGSKPPPSYSPSSASPPVPPHPQSASSLPPPIPTSSRPGSYTSPPPPQGQQPYSPPPPQAQPQSSYNQPPAPSPIHSQTYWYADFSPHLPVSQNFQHETGAHGWGNNEAQNYTSEPSNSFHTPDGKLVMRASARNNTYTSARLVTHQKLSRKQGYLEARLTPPCALGVWPAFWLLPTEHMTWPTDGEVDILETWNGDCVNHSCLHWGHFNGEDSQKHRVVDTTMGPGFAQHPHTFGFGWDEPALVWYIDGRAVMKATKPPGTRGTEDFQVILNVAMGGNVCQGKLPQEGDYDFVVSELKMCHEPPGGWEKFRSDWMSAPEGHAM